MISFRKVLVVAALSLMTAACASSTEAPMTELDRGLVLLKEDQNEQARVHYAAMLARDPENAYVHLNLGAALEKLGRKDEAAAHYQRAIELGRDKPVYLVVVGDQETNANTDVATMAQDNLGQLRAKASSKAAVAIQ